MKALKNTLVIFISVVSLSCTPDIALEEVKSDLNPTELNYYPGGDDDIVDETEKDDE